MAQEGYKLIGSVEIPEAQEAPKGPEGYSFVGTVGLPQEVKGPKGYKHIGTIDVPSDEIQSSLPKPLAENEEALRRINLAHHWASMLDESKARDAEIPVEDNTVVGKIAKFGTRALFGMPRLTGTGYRKIGEVTGVKPIAELGKEAEQYWTEQQESGPRIVRSYKIGTAQAELGLRTANWAMGDTSTQNVERIKELKAMIPKGYQADKESRSLVERALSGTAEQIPIWIEGAKESARYGLVTGMAAGGVTAATGLGAPAAPAAFATGYAAGSLYGSLNNIGKIEAGLALDSILEMKDDDGKSINPEIAKIASIPVGIVNAWLELGQIKTLLKTIPGGETVIKNAMGMITKNVLKSKPVQNALWQGTKGYGVFLGKESLQEVEQEITPIMAEEFSKQVTNVMEGANFKSTTVAEVTERLTNTFTESALSFAPMGIPGIGSKMIQTQRRNGYVASVTNDIVTKTGLSTSETKGLVEEAYIESQNDGKKFSRVLTDKVNDRIKSEMKEAMAASLNDPGNPASILDIQKEIVKNRENNPKLADELQAFLDEYRSSMSPDELNKLIIESEGAKLNAGPLVEGWLIGNRGNILKGEKAAKGQGIDYFNYGVYDVSDDVRKIWEQHFPGTEAKGAPRTYADRVETEREGEPTYTAEGKLVKPPVPGIPARETTSTLPVDETLETDEGKDIGEGQNVEQEGIEPPKWTAKDVAVALQLNKPVPPEILAQYPDLAKTFGVKVEKEEKAGDVKPAIVATQPYIERGPKVKGTDEYVLKIMSPEGKELGRTIGKHSPEGYAEALKAYNQPAASQSKPTEPEKKAEVWKGTLYRGEVAPGEKVTDRIPSQFAEGEHWTPQKEVAETYGKTIREEKVNLKNPYVWELPRKKEYYKEMEDEFGTDDPKEVTRILREKGHDGLVVKNVGVQRRGPKGAIGVQNSTEVIVFKEPEKKIAPPTEKKETKPEKETVEPEEQPYPYWRYFTKQKKFFLPLVQKIRKGIDMGAGHDPMWNSFVRQFNEDMSVGNIPFMSPPSGLEGQGGKGTVEWTADEVLSLIREEMARRESKGETAPITVTVTDEDLQEDGFIKEEKLDEIVKEEDINIQGIKEELYEEGYSEQEINSIVGGLKTVLNDKIAGAEIEATLAELKEQVKQAREQPKELPKTPGNFKEFIKELDAEKERRMAIVREQIGPEGGEVKVRKYDQNWTLIISRNISGEDIEKYPWRVTSIDERGPVGHTIHSKLDGIGSSPVDTSAVEEVAHWLPAEEVAWPEVETKEEEQPKEEIKKESPKSPADGSLFDTSSMFSLAGNQPVVQKTFKPPERKGERMLDVTKQTPEELQERLSGEKAKKEFEEENKPEPITYEQFSKLYRDAFEQGKKYTPKQAGFNVTADTMANLADSYPEYMERFDKEIEEEKYGKEKGEQPDKTPLISIDTAKALLQLPASDHLKAYGSYNIALRKQIMKELTGKDVPITKAGANAVYEGLLKEAGIIKEDNSAIAGESQLRKWLKGIIGENEAVDNSKKEDILKEGDEGYGTVEEQGVLFSPGGETTERNPVDRRLRGNVSAKTEVVSEEVGHYKAGTTKITSPDDVADIGRNLTRDPQETFGAILIKEDGTVHSVHRVSRGSQSATLVHPTIVVGQALNSKGVTGIWLIHNHPSGLSGLSDEDTKLGQRITVVAQESGVQVHGLMAVTPNKYTTIEYGNDLLQSGKTPKNKQTKRIPVVERRFVKQKGDAKDAITNPRIAVEKINKLGITSDNDKITVGFLDNQNNLLSTISVARLFPIRGEIQRQLLEEAERRNAVSLMIYAPQQTIGGQDSTNIASFGKIAGIKVLDVIDKTGSLEQQGRLYAGQDTFYKLTTSADLDAYSFSDLRPPDKPRFLVRQVEQFIALPLKRWGNIGNVKVIQTMGELPAEWMQYVVENAKIMGGYYPPTDTTYIVADNIANARAAVVTLAHEVVGHRGIDAILGPIERKVVMANIAKAYENDKTLQKLAAGYKFNLTREDAAKNVFGKEWIELSDNEQRRAEKMVEDDRISAAAEMIAHMSESKTQTPILTKIMGIIRAALRRVMPNMKWTNADVMHLINRARQFSGVMPKETTGAYFKKALDTTTDAFQRWFKDSKVVDEKGKPLVVYHGTRWYDIEEFSPAMIGTSTDHGYYGKGFYFSSRTETASNYANKSGSLTLFGHVIPAYLSLQKPFIVDWSTQDSARETADRFKDIGVERNGWGTPKNSDEFTKKAIEAGYDGVIANGTEYVAFKPTQIKSIYNQGTWNPEDARISYKQSPPIAPTFFSKMERFLSAKLPNTGTAESMKQLINSWANKGEFKQDELKWSGLMDYLDGKEGKVSKQEIVDFIKANQIEIKEVMKGDFPYQVRDNTGALLGQYATENEAYDARDRFRETLYKIDNSSEVYIANANDTKFSAYQLPGGENYREMLFTLPDQGLQLPPEGLRKAIVHMEMVREEARNKYGRHSTEYEEADLKLAELKNKETDFTFQEQTRLSKERYQSSHWSELNVIAHTRLNDRTDAEGKKVLFVEEVQSDWHQKGREKGYKRPAKYTREDIEQSYPDSQEHWNLRNSGLSIAGATPERALEYFNSLGRTHGVVPPAPFAKTWHEFVLKRLLRMAAEQGYDSIAWSYGDVQADRYDLSKQISKLKYYLDDGHLKAFDLQGTSVIDKMGINERELPDYIGKEATKKLMDSTPIMEYNDKKKEQVYELSGLDLKVGGQGMSGFYDKMIPDFLNKYGKKWGARVEDIAIRTTIKKPDDFSNYKNIKGMEGDITVHSFPITDSMRESVLYEGQPMFRKNIPSTLSIADILAKAEKEAGIFDDRMAKESDPPSPDASPKQIDNWFKREKGILFTHLARTVGTESEFGKYLEKMVKSPEWWTNPVLRRIVHYFTDTRSEAYHEYIYHLNKIDDKDVIKETEAMQKKQPEKYKQLLWAIDYMDTSYKRSKEVMEKLNEPDITLEAREAIHKNSLKKSEEFLRSKGLPDDVIDLWKLHRASYDRALNLMNEQMREMIAYLEDEKLMKGEIDDSREELLKTLHGYLANMEEWRGFYAPRLREPGDWELVLQKGDDKIRLHGSSMKMERVWRQLSAEGWEPIGGMKKGESPVRRIKRLPEEVYQSLKTVDVAKAITYAMEHTKEVTAEVTAAFNDEVLEVVSDMIKARGFRSSMIHRMDGKVMKGYEEDPLTRFIRYSNNISSGLAKAKVARLAYEEILGQKNEKGERVGGLHPIENKQDYLFAKKYLEFQLRNLDHTDRLIGIAKSIATFKFLGLNPRSILVNLTALSTTAPAAVHQYAGKGKVSMSKVLKEIVKASKDAAQIIANKTPTLPDNEKAYIEKIIKEGWDDPQYARDAMGAMQKTHLKWWNKTMSASMWAFGKSEQLNRLATLLTGYRIAYKQAIKAGMKEQDAIEKAEQLAKSASDKAHGIYGKATLPMIAQLPYIGKIGQLMYVYGKFGHNYVQMLYDLGVNQHNFKALAWGLIAPIVLAGGTVLPFKDALWGLLGAILKMFGIGGDPEKSFWDWIRKQFGKQAEKLGRYGLMGGLGVDISGSLSVGIDLPKSLKDLGGAPWGAIEDVMKSGHFAATGRPVRAVEKILPTGLANIARAFREQKEGVTTEKGFRVFTPENKPYRPSLGEMALRFGGFRSAEEATLSSRTRETKREKSYFDEKKRSIYEEYRGYLADPQRTKKDHSDIVRKVQEFNRQLKQEGVKEVPRITFEQMKVQARRMQKPTKAQRRLYAE